jgi:hypothetical protein
MAICGLPLRFLGSISNVSRFGHPWALATRRDRCTHGCRVVGPPYPPEGEAWRIEAASVFTNVAVKRVWYGRGQMNLNKKDRVCKRRDVGRPTRSVSGSQRGHGLGWRC